MGAHMWKLIFSSDTTQVVARMPSTHDQKLELKMNTKKLFKNEQGASIVEFAIVLPLFLVFIFGIIEFGLIMYNKAMITNASREGARQGILYTKEPLSGAEVTKKAKDAVEEKLKNADGGWILISLGGNEAPVIEPNPDFDSDPKYLEVKVTYPYSFLLLPELKFGGNLSNPFPIQAITTMIMENQEDPEE